MEKVVRLSLVVVMASLVACGSTGGQSGPTCTAGIACTPSGTADPCKAYATTCDASGMVSTCSVAESRPDGYACATGSVCSGGACQAACVAGQACTPSGAASSCQTYATTCDATLAHTTCSVSGTH